MHSSLTENRDASRAVTNSMIERGYTMDRAEILRPDGADPHSIPREFNIGLISKHKEEHCFPEGFCSARAEYLTGSGEPNDLCVVRVFVPPRFDLIKGLACRVTKSQIEIALHKLAEKEGIIVAIQHLE